MIAHQHSLLLAPFLQAAAARGLNTSHIASPAEGQSGAGQLLAAWGVDPAVLESSPLYYAPLAYSMGELVGRKPKLIGALGPGRPPERPL